MEDLKTSERREADELREVQTPALDLLLLLTARARFIMLMTLGAMLLALAAVLVIPPTYTATALILPPQTPQSSMSAMLGQIGSLAGLGGSGALKNPADLYIGILQSRNIMDRVIGSYHLLERWHAKTMTAVRTKLADASQFESTKDGMIQISVKGTDPKLASNIANFYVDALSSVNSSLVVIEAGQRRLFFERQLDAEKEALGNAEEALKRTQEKTGLLTVPGQTDVAIRSVAQTRAQISALEVQLQGMRTYATEENPDVQRFEQELRTLRAQLSNQEDSAKTASSGSPEIATGQVPEGGLEYARKLREVKYHETLLDLLSRQYEAARIDEAKSVPVIQVIDRAEPPDQRSGPRRLLIILGSGFLGFLLACGSTLYKGALSQALQEPLVAGKWRQLRASMPWARS